MIKLRLTATAFIFSVASAATFAGGILTNTNQSVEFLKNPARDAAIGIDGVYSNPAGVAFMSNGFHLAINWQMAHQTRTITSTNPLFALGKHNDGNITKEFEGVADARFIPSVQAAYNTDKWSFQFNFSMPGGGGVCEFSNGLGSFESAVGMILFWVPTRCRLQDRQTLVCLWRSARSLRRCILQGTHQQHSGEDV